MKTLLDDGVHVLIGDYLAELTMLILRKTELRGGTGYAHTFVSQLKDNLQQIKDQASRSWPTPAVSRPKSAPPPYARCAAMPALI